MKNQRGFTLIEILIAICIFLITATGIYFTYANLIQTIGRTRTHTLATSLLNKEIEIIRNLPYDSVGIIGGYPIGQLTSSKSVNYEGQTFTVNTTVRNTDDPFDGMVGGGVVGFQYPVQAGAGGITMANQASITGSVYSNGNVLGGNSGGVSGSVTVAGNRQIQNAVIGGDARAHTISGSTITGAAYYQTISGSTVGGGSHPGSSDPASGTLAIAQSQIDGWKSEAVASGTYVGDYNLTNSDTATIGPLKIQGNLNVQNNAVLTLTGKVWVTGTITLANNGAIQLASSYGTKSGTLISDGTVSMINSSDVCGSEGFNTSTKVCNTSNGSLILMISTSSANPAINIQNSTDMRGIMYALTGYVTVANTAILRQASGYGINIQNTAKVIYDSAITTVNTGSAPFDTAPADHKIVEVEVDCPTCFNFVPISFTTWVSPQNLEASTKNGSLFITVFDANGIVVPDADVLVKNMSTTPTITINDSTGMNGILQLIDIPTSTNAYQIFVSKSGYSSAQTYSVSSTNTNPTPPHATVASQQVTAISFAIDRVSEIDVKTQNQFCVGVPSVTLSQSGSKLIGTNPNIVKYSNRMFTTDSNGVAARTGLEWDSYSFLGADAAYDFAGTSPLIPMFINPHAINPLSVLVTPKASSSSLLVTTLNTQGGPIKGVSVSLSKTGFTTLTKLTGENMFTTTDWSSSTYTSQDGTIDTESVPGQIMLKSINGSYPTSSNSYLISNTIDFGTSTIGYHQLSWSSSIPSGTSIKFQIATSNDSSSLTNFLGPNSTNQDYYNVSPYWIWGGANDKRYMRYKLFMNTTNQTVTPQLNDLSIAFDSSCVPSGQALFQNLGSGTYTVTAALYGYQTTTTSTAVVGSGWQGVTLVMPTSSGGFFFSP